MFPSFRLLITRTSVMLVNPCTGARLPGANSPRDVPHVPFAGSAALSTAIHSAARSWLWETAPISCPSNNMPVKSDLQKHIGKQKGDTVVIHLQERIEGPVESRASSCAGCSITLSRGTSSKRFWCKTEPGVGDDGQMPRFVPIEELFKGRHFDQEIVVLCVRWYLSYKLSSRDLVAMMDERGIGLVQGDHPAVNSSLHSGVRKALEPLRTHVSVHPGFVNDTGPLNEQRIDVQVQQGVNLRCGADLLLTRKDVDPKRLAYVGHSCDASAGAFLSGLDKRFTAKIYEMRRPML
jgi:hypothetical protein